MFNNKIIFTCDGDFCQQETILITDDSNGDETIKVICRQWNQTWAYDDFYSLSATFERVYEA